MKLRNVHWWGIYGLVICVCLVCLFVDIKGKVAAVYLKNSEAKNLSQQVVLSKDAIINATQKSQAVLSNVDNTLLDTSNALALLVGLFEKQDISVTKMQLLKVRVVNGVNMLPVKVSAAGDVIAFYKLMYSLLESDRPIVVNDFSVVRDSRGAVVVELQVLLFGVRMKGVAVGDSFSLTKVKWGGFFRQGRDSYGILVLPGGEVVEVQVGMVVGEEKGEVVEVNEDEVCIKVGGKFFRVGSGAV